VAPTAGIRTTRGVAGTPTMVVPGLVRASDGFGGGRVCWPRCAVCVGCPAGTIPSWAARSRLADGETGQGACG